MDFKLNGEKIVPNNGPDSKSIKKKLDQLKDGDLYTTPLLSELTGVSGAYIRDSLSRKLTLNCYMAGGKYIWGNEKTIKAYKAALNE